MHETLGAKLCYAVEHRDPVDVFLVVPQGEEFLYQTMSFTIIAFCDMITPA